MIFSSNVFNLKKRRQVFSGICEISALSNNDITRNTNLNIPGFNVIHFSHTSINTLTASFTLTISSAPTNKKIYYILVGGGGGGGSGEVGGGGGGAGEIRNGEIDLPNGIYNFNISIGNGGRGSDYVATNSSLDYADGSNGYGCKGNDTTLSWVNNSRTTTITTRGGGPGGPSHGRNKANNFPCGGGSGCIWDMNTDGSGATGTRYNGGSAPTITTSRNVSSAGGGASFKETGSNGNTSSTVAQGGRGGRAFSSLDFTNFPLNSFQPIIYFSEGGCGASTQRAQLYSENGTVSDTRFGGRGSGAIKAGFVSADQRCTSGTISSNGGWGSGGGGAFQNAGIGSTSYAGSGANGVIILIYR